MQHSTWHFSPKKKNKKKNPPTKLDVLIRNASDAPGYYFWTNMMTFGNSYALAEHIYGTFYASLSLIYGIGHETK